jgi:hypothetical protein
MDNAVVSYPKCPSCGRLFNITGLYRLRGDGRDVDAFTHNGDCEAVYAVAEDDPTRTLHYLGNPVG